MFNSGLEEEVRSLMRRERLTSKHPSMRSVGYRQVWSWLSGEVSEPEARDLALFATRQLAKRQITWMRSYPGLECFDALAPETPNAVEKRIKTAVDC